MSEVHVPFGDNTQDQAILLLAEAQKAGVGPQAVRTVSGGFMTSQEIAEAAGVEYDRDDEEQPREAQAADEQPREEEKPAKKAPASRRSKED